MKEIYEPCSICEEYYIEGVICNKDKCPIAKMKAENERLRKYYNDMESAIYEFRKDQAEVKFLKNKIKTEAIKEFAERLKNIYIKDKRYDRPNAHTLIDWLFANIDNLVKEMVGEE